MAFSGTPVFDAFNTGGGTYTYSIVLQQLDNPLPPAPAQFGVRTGDPLAFQSFDQADRSSVFALSTFTSTDGFRIQGQFTTATSPVPEETITRARTAAPNPEGDALSYADSCISNTSLSAASDPTWDYISNILGSNPSLSINLFGGSQVVGGNFNQRSTDTSRSEDFSSRESQPCATPLLSGVSGAGQTRIQALTTEEPLVPVDRLTGTNYITLNGESYAGQLTRVRAASPLLPEGIRFSRNGMARVISNGVQVLYAVE